MLKKFNEFLNESEDKLLTAKDLKIGMKIVYRLSDPKIQGGKMQVSRGTIYDHFGDGVFINLDNPITYYDPEEMEPGVYHGTRGFRHSSKLTQFELHDGDNNPYGSFKNLSIASVQ